MVVQVSTIVGSPESAPVASTSSRVNIPVYPATAPGPRLWQLVPQFEWSQASDAAVFMSPGTTGVLEGGFVSAFWDFSVARFIPDARGDARLTSSKPRTKSSRPLWQVWH